MAVWAVHRPVARHENCLGVGITLYGHTPEQHDAYLGAGTFEQILQTLESLRQESLPFSLSVSFDATNISQAEATLSFVVSQRPTGVRCQVLRDPLTGMVMASPAELCQLSAVIREVAASHLVTIGCDVHPAKDLQIPGATYQGCPVGRHILSLLPNGDITGCPRFMQHDNRLGRVATHSLLDVIQAEQHHFEERFWNKDYCPLARSLSIG